MILNYNHFRLLPLLAAFALAGCNSIPFIDTTPDYKGATRGKPLEVPPDLTAASTSDVYTVPGSGTTYSEFSDSQAQAKQQQEAVVLPTSDSVRMERAGSQRWLVVQAPPEKIWPVVREFWNELGFNVRIENPQTGLMETEWVDTAKLMKNADEGYLDKFQGWLDQMSSLQKRQKFRTRLERGAEAGVTEIYLSHQSVSDVPDDGKVRVRTIAGEVETGYKQSDFDKKKTSPEARALAEDIDAELLRRLMVRLGIEEGKSRTIMATSSNEKRADLSKSSDGSYSLTVNDQFDRAWRRVGLALDRIGFVVEDRDRSRGVFYVRYADLEVVSDSKDDKGWLDKLKFWGDADVQDKSNPENKYLVKVDNGANSSNITVTDREGKRERSETANRILSMLYDQLK
jgi:outer membrane protein assembly factor BamC